MRLMDKLFGRSRILTLRKLHYQNRDGEPVMISKDIRYTIRCGNSTLHMYEWQDVVDYCKKYGYTPALCRVGGVKSPAEPYPKRAWGHMRKIGKSRGVYPHKSSNQI